MNQGMYDLILAELQASRKAWDASVAELEAFQRNLIMEGNGTLRDPSEHVLREFRDSTPVPSTL